MGPADSPSGEVPEAPPGGRGSEAGFPEPAWSFCTQPHPIIPSPAAIPQAAKNSLRENRMLPTPLPKPKIPREDSLAPILPEPPPFQKSSIGTRAVGTTFFIACPERHRPPWNLASEERIGQECLRSFLSPSFPTGISSSPLSRRFRESGLSQKSHEAGGFFYIRSLPPRGLSIGTSG